MPLAPFIAFNLWITRRERGGNRRRHISYQFMHSICAVESLGSECNIAKGEKCSDSPRTRRYNRATCNVCAKRFDSSDFFLSLSHDTLTRKENTQLESPLFIRFAPAIHQRGAYIETLCFFLMIYLPTSSSEEGGKKDSPCNF